MCAPTDPANSAARRASSSAAARTSSAGDERPPFPNSGFRCVPVAIGVDAVPVECGADLVEVLLGELLRVVELVVVHEVAEPHDGTRDLHGRRFSCVLGLIPAGDEARDHRPECPYAE